MRWTVVVLLVVLAVCSGRPQNDDDCEGKECGPMLEPEPEPEVTTTKAESEPEVTTTTEAEPEVTTTEAEPEVTTTIGPDPDNSTDPVDDDHVDMDDTDTYDNLHHDDHHHHYYRRRRQAEGGEMPHYDMDDVVAHHHSPRRQSRQAEEEFAVRSPEPRNQVAFTVREAEVFTGPARLRFGRVLTNVGGGWDQHLAEFVAPYTGGYFFTFHALADLNDDFTLALFKNRDHQVTAYGSKDDYQHASNSVFLKLNRRDRVYLELQEGRIFEHPRNEVYTTFTGFMLYRN